MVDSEPNPTAVEPDPNATAVELDPAAAPAAAEEPAAASAEPDLAARAQALAARFLIVDGHIDLPYRLFYGRADDGSITEDVAKRTETGDFDYVRARAGGLDAPFMSIYVPAKLQRRKGQSKRHADLLIDIVEGLVERDPDKFALAGDIATLEANTAADKVTLLMGIENGAAIEDDLKNLTHFYNRGVRYITLTHAKDNQICDSSYDKAGTWNGLSRFGRKVVAEMNRLGILVDVSHISDNAFHQVMDIAKAPVIASHSSARHFTPGFERNLGDDMIRRIGKNGGVVMVNFGSTFLLKRIRDYHETLRASRNRFMKTHGITDSEAPEAMDHDNAYMAANPAPFADVTDVADHIDHIVELAGIDHVGFGSDFDGVGDTLPIGLKDPTGYPNLIRVLLERGYSEADIEKICSGNLLRVWREAQAYADSAAK
ncbi:MAG: dipeptidase [Haliangiales bacterium]